jgi:hypothetical protein
MFESCHVIRKEYVMVRAYEDIYADYMSLLRRRREANQLGLFARLTANEHALIDETSEAEERQAGRHKRPSLLTSEWTKETL